MLVIYCSVDGRILEYIPTIMVTPTDWSHAVATRDWWRRHFDYHAMLGYID